MTHRTNSKKVTINVTKKDIEQGRPYLGDSCAVALALGRATRAKGVSVGYCSTEFWTRDGRWHASNTQKLERFVEDFDHGLSVKPVKFTLTFSRGH